MIKKNKHPIIILQLILICVIFLACKTMAVPLESKPEVKHRFQDNKDGTITDKKTGLMWTKSDSMNKFQRCLDWNMSRSYVKELRTGGYSDWRMPSVKEIQSIVSEEIVKLDGGNESSGGKKLMISSRFSPGGSFSVWSLEEADYCCALGVYLVGNVVRDASRGHFGIEGARAARSPKSHFAPS